MVGGFCLCSDKIRVLYYMGQPYPNSFNNQIETKSLNPNMVDLLSGMTRHNPPNTFDT